MINSDKPMRLIQNYIDKSSLYLHCLMQTIGYVAYMVPDIYSHK